MHMRFPRFNRQLIVEAGVDGVRIDDGGLPTAEEVLMNGGSSPHFFVGSFEGVAMAFNEEVVKERADAARERLARERSVGKTALQ